MANDFPHVVIHDLAVVSAGGRDDAETLIGAGTGVWAFAYVGPGAKIGLNCTIGQGAHIGPDVVIGDGCKIQNGAQLFEGVVLEHDVFIGPHVVLTNVKTPRAFVNRKAEFTPTLVKHGASIGANATILCGVTIGEYAMIGAGTVVTRNVEPHAIVTGVPETGVGWACRCGERLYERSGGMALRFHPAQIQKPSAVTCERCGAAYIYDGSLTFTEVLPDAKATP